MHGPRRVRQTNEQGTSDSAKDDEDGARSESATTHDVYEGSGRKPDVPPTTRQSSSIVATNMGPGIPTMRSRVTVVCAECKKQKLRCDRRIPCESCVKRNTVSRCVYTPAAIEKVDMTSINNRLRVVEGSLNALGVPTQGIQQLHSSQPQINQPGILSFLNTSGMGVSLPGAQVTALPVNVSPSRVTSASDFANDTTTNAPPPRILATSNDERCSSTVATLDGVAKLWVHEIIEEMGDVSPYTTSVTQKDTRSSLGLPEPVTRNMVTSSRLKLDLEPIDRESKGGFSAFGCRAKRALGPRQWLELHAGLGISSPTTEIPQPYREATTEHIPSKNLTVANSLSDLYGPLTTGLLSQFPCQRSRREMLVRLGIVYMIEGFNCIPFGAFCEKIEALFSSVSREDLQRIDEARSPTPALSAVAEAAAGLAVGALLWATESLTDTAGNAEVLRRIVSQAMEQSIHFDPGHEGALDRPSPETAFALYRLAQLASAIHTAGHGHAAQDVSVIHTRILSSYYLILAHSTSGGFSDSLLPPELPSLVGSLIWEARAMGLGIDPDEFDSSDEVLSHSTILVSNDDHVVGSSFKREDIDEDSTSVPRGKGMSLFLKEVRRRLWWWIVWLDLFVSDAYGHSATILPEEYSTRLPAIVDDTSFRPDSDVLPPPDNTCLERTNVFYINKVRVLEIVKHAPVRAFRGRLVPKITEDPDAITAAATQKLADEIMQWLEELPERFKLDAADGELPLVTFSQKPMTSLRPPSEVEEERNVARAMLVSQRCDLAFHSYHTLLRLYIPRLPSTLSFVSRHGKTPRIGDKVMSNDQQFAGLRAVQPALAIVQAAEMQMTYAPDLPRGTFHMHMLPRRLFDAAVVLAHTAIQQSLYTAPVVMEAVRSARGILSHVLNNGAEVDTSEVQRTEAELVIDALLKRAEKAMSQSTPIVAGRKRKHEDIESDAVRFDTPFRFPFLGTGIVNVYCPPTQTTISLGDSSLTSVVTMGQRTSHFTQGNNSCSRHSEVGSGRRGKAVPVVSIRQRVRDRRAERIAVNTSRTESSPVDSGSREPPSFLLPRRPSSQQAVSAVPSTSSSPSFFPSESISASPVSPASRYDVNHGTRLINPGTAYSLQVNDAPQDVHPVGAAPLQRPLSLPTTNHYPAPNVVDPSYSAPVSLQQHHDHLDGPVGASEYGLDSTHLDQAGHLGQNDQRGNGVQSWATSSYDDQQNRSLATPSPHPVGVYSSDQHTQQQHASSWTTGENISSTSLAPPWNVGLFNNWDHDSR